jgi:hypothetical protein
MGFSFPEGFPGAQFQNSKRSPSVCAQSQGATTPLVSKDSNLLITRINIFALDTIPGGQTFGKGAVMLKSSSGHFSDQGIVPHEQGLQPAPPSSGLRMVGISPLLFGQYGPNSMELPVFSKEMLTTQFFRWNIPNSHTGPASIRGYLPKDYLVIR